MDIAKRNKQNPILTPKDFQPAIEGMEIACLLNPGVFQLNGRIALLIRVLSNHTPKEIVDADLYFIDKIGLREHLSPTRSNGLLSMVKQIRMYAVAYQAKENAQA